MNGGSEDPLRRLARERGTTMAELGVRPEDAAWTRTEAATTASLVTADLRLRLPAGLARLWRRIRRAAR